MIYHCSFLLTQRILNLFIIFHYRRYLSNFHLSLFWSIIGIISPAISGSLILFNFYLFIWIYLWILRDDFIQFPLFNLIFFKSRPTKYICYLTTTNMTETIWRTVLFSLDLFKYDQTTVTLNSSQCFTEVNRVQTY